jgi:ABC-2 type transport system ATP-binding protein
MFWGRMYGVGGSRLKKSVDEVLEIAGLKERSGERIDKYSGGMKRRINVAAALLHKPEVLFMDEPTVGIDPQSRNHILETVRKLNDEGMTVIYTSHYMEEVEYLCRRVAIMDHGKIIAKGTKEEVKALVDDRESIVIEAQNINEEIKDKLLKVDSVDEVILNENTVEIISMDNDFILAKIIGVLETEDAGIISVDIKEPNLEAVFLHLTGRALRD